MTQEEKAKAYDKALNIAKSILKTRCIEGIFGSFHRKDLEDIFPELKESEDDEIRQYIIRLMKQKNQNVPMVKKTLAWLEKQSELIEINQTEFDSRLNKLLKQFETLPKEELENCLSFYLNVVHNNGPYKEKQVEQEPTTIDVDKMVMDYATNDEKGNEKFGKPINCMIRAYKQGICDAIKKQGEQKPIITALEAWKDIRLEVYQQASGNRHDPNYSDDTTKMFSLNDIDEIFEKIADTNVEQKPTIQPRFKPGDWITDGNITIQIEAVRNNCYLYNGDCALYSTKIADKVYHLWTIQDAKSGNILATSAGAFIYNGNNGGGSCPGSYCGIDTLGRFKTGVKHHWTGKKVYPATKEQCDTLFAKMKEAGYKWNADKKKPEKIEQNFDELLCDTRIQYASVEAGIKRFAETYSFNIESNLFHQLTKEQQELWRKEIEQACISGGNAGIELARDMRYKENKPAAWSEEDEKHYLKCLDLLIERTESISIEEIHKEWSPIIDWLKSLKDRVQPKQEWSEEEVKNLNRISMILLDASEVKQWWKEYRIIEKDEMIKLTDFLKSLRPQKQWKPKQEWSQEDMNRFSNLIYLVQRSDEGHATKEGFIEFINRLSCLKQCEPTKGQLNKSKFFCND